MPRELIDIFPRAEDLLELAPEELAGLIIELRMQAGGKMFTPEEVVHFSLQQHPDGRGYTHRHRTPVINAVFEALEWLKSQGLLMRPPEQPNGWLMFTRRGEKLKTRADLEAYRKASILQLNAKPSATFSLVPLVTERTRLAIATLILNLSRPPALFSSPRICSISLTGVSL
jgi:hypothetical protein